MTPKKREVQHILLQEFELMISGIILAGGLSTRLGRDKSLEPIENQTMISRIHEKLLQITSDITIVVNTKEKANKIPLDNVEIAIDLYPNCGSLGGIFTGLTHAKQQWAFIVACDMPFINIKLIQKMIELRENNDAVVPYLNNFPEPTHALYSKNCLPYIERYLKQNELKISNFFRDINMKKVTREIIEKYDPDSLSLFNINNQKELNSAKQILRNKSKS